MLCSELIASSIYINMLWNLGHIDILSVSNVLLYRAIYMAMQSCRSKFIRNMVRRPPPPTESYKRYLYNVMYTHAWCCLGLGVSIHTLDNVESCIKSGTLINNKSTGTCSRSRNLCVSFISGFMRTPLQPPSS